MNNTSNENKWTLLTLSTNISNILSIQIKKILFTHIQLPNEASNVVMLEVERQNFLRKACLIKDMETSSIL